MAFVSLAAAAIAVITWDLAQLHGITIGQNSFGLNANQANYYAGLHTGLAEGPTQYLIGLLGLDDY